MQPKTILITGASSGIGLCCAQGLKDKGYRVIATARKEKDVDHLKKLGLESLPLDINDSDSISQALKKTLELTGGKIDVLFNNCSYAQPGAVEDLSRQALREQFETNLFGPMELTAQAIKIMREQNSGRIIFTGSLLGYVTMPFRSAYNASKFALEGMIDTLRQELHGSSIHVSLIEPGPIHTNIRDNAKNSFLKNIDLESSAHRDVYKKMQESFFSIDAKTSFYLPPEAVLKKLMKAIEDKQPKTRYYVGFPAHLFRILKRILPDKYLDTFIRQIVKKEI